LIGIGVCVTVVAMTLFILMNAFDSPIFVRVLVLLPLILICYLTIRSKPQPQQVIVPQLGPNATQQTVITTNSNHVRPQTLDINPTQTLTRAFTSPMPSAPNLSEEHLMARDGLPTYEEAVSQQN
jgi:hypothetical protein